MPAPTTVTSEQVIQAAAMLAEQGKPITGWTLRGVIGSGRPDRLLAVWREQQGLPAYDDPDPANMEKRGSAPDCPRHLLSMAEEWGVEMRRHIDVLNRSMWLEAHTAAEEAHKSEVDGLRARVAALDGELYGAEQQVAALEDSVYERYAEAESIRTAAVRKAEAADAAIAKAQADVERALAEVARARSEADGHREANARLQATLDELVQRLPGALPRNVASNAKKPNAA